VTTHRIIVCGSRNFLSGNGIDDLIGTVIEGIAANFENVTIVHGAAKGADWHAARCAEVAGDQEGTLTIEPHPADWERHGKAAGPIRNQQMADAGADLCIAFTDQPVTPGTADMIRRAKKTRIPVWVIGHG
jgi:YspA, cpYpsA-related SLOG family